jgi:hypothetical protein
MIRKLLVLGLIVGGVAFAAAQSAYALNTHLHKSAHRTHRAKSRSHTARSHSAHSRSRSSRKHSARVSHASKAAPRTGKATHRA